MMARVPATHESVRQFLSTRARKRLALIHRALREDPVRFEAWKKRHQQEIGHTELDSIRPEHLDPRNFNINLTRPAAIATALSPLPDLVETICRMSWSLLTTEPPHWFITSDAPCCMIDPTIPAQVRATVGNGGLASWNVELSLPLSPRVAFFAGWQGRESGYKAVSRDVVEEINLRTVNAAQRLMIAPKPVFPGSDRLTPAR
jgi:hypothetical protein